MEVKIQDATLRPSEPEITQVSPPSHHNQSGNEKAESTTSALSTDSLSQKYGWPIQSLEITHDDQPSSSSNIQPQPQRSRSLHFAINQSPSSRNEKWKFSKIFDRRRSRKASLHHQPRNEKVESTTSALSERHGWTPNTLENSHEDQPSSSNNPQPQLRSRGSHVVHLPIDQLFRISSAPNQRRVDSKSFNHQRPRKALSDHHQLANGKMKSTTPVLSTGSPSERYGWTSHSLEIDHDSQPSSSNDPQPQPQSEGSEIVHLQVDQLHSMPSTSRQRPIGSKSFDHHHHQQGNGKADFTTSMLPPSSLSEGLGWTTHSLENTPNIQPPSSHIPQPPLQSRGSHSVHLPNDQPDLVPSNHNRIHVNIESIGRQRFHKIPPCCLLFSGILLIFVILLVIAGCIVYLLLMPKKPRLFIENISLLFTRSHPQNLHPDYNFSIESENPNRQVGIQYFDHGFASLSYKSQEIATGRPPALYQGKNVTLHFNLLLESKDVLPKEMEDILKENKSRVEVPLSLFMNIPVKMKLWKIETWRMRMRVLCQVSTLVLGQEDFESKHCERTILYSG